MATVPDGQVSRGGRLDIPCARLGDGFRETVGRVHCLYCVKLGQEREIWRRKRPIGRCTVREDMALVPMRLLVRTNMADSQVRMRSPEH